MPVTALHHFTIRCTPGELPPLLDFYTRIMRLTPGPRPVMAQPGAWLYAEGQPIVHLYAYLPEPEAITAPATGHVDHIAFGSRGLNEMRQHLTGLAVPFTEAPIPGWDMHQLFLHDPRGLKIELTFWLRQEGTEDEGAA